MQRFEIVSTFIHIFISSLIITCTTLYAQITLNPGVDTSSAVHKVIINFWKDYLASRPSRHTQEHLTFWHPADRNFLPQPDLALHSINTEVSTFAMGYATVLSVMPYEDQLYEVRTAVGSCRSSGAIQLMAVTRHFVSLESGQPMLVSPLRLGLFSIVTERAGFRLYHPKTWFPSADLLDSLKNFGLYLRKIYDLPPDGRAIRIVMGRDAEETYDMMGVAFNLLTATNSPGGGYVDVTNNVLIVKGTASLFHELTHYLLDPVFPQSPLQEGLATFYGGSLGKSLEEGLRFMALYAEEHPEVILSDVVESRTFYLNNLYNPAYLLQGLMIRLAFEKEGVSGIRKIMALDQVEKVWEDYFKISSAPDREKFLRAALKRFRY